MVNNMLACLDHPVTTEQFRTSDLSVEEFACPGWPERCPEDGVTRPEIVLPRGGFYERRNRYGQVFVDRTVVLFFDPNDPFEIHHQVRTPDSSTVVSIGNRLIDELSTLPGQDASPFFAIGAMPSTSSIALAHHALLRSMFYGKTSDPIATEEQTLLLVAEVFTQLRKRRMSYVPKSSRRNRREAASGYRLTQAVSCYLNDNFGAEITLQDIADVVDRSPFHLCRTIKKYTGQTIHQRLTSLRLDSALEFLWSTRRPITEIALDVGYSSHSHFTALFKKKFGVSPLIYRNSA